MQALGNHKVSMQLFRILVHLDIQQPRPGQGNPEVVFWQLHRAFQAANADPDYDMVAWAQSYHTHQLTHPQEQHPSVVVHLSNQILQWTQQWPLVQNQAQAMQPAQLAFNQQGHVVQQAMPPAQHQAQAMQLAQPPFNQQGHPVQEQGQAMQPVQPAFNQQAYVVQQEGQAMQPAQHAFNQHGPLVQQEGHLMQPAQPALNQQGPVAAQHEVLAMQLAQPALHQPGWAADHGMANDAVHYAAADGAAQAGVDDDATGYGAAGYDADGYGATYGVAGHDSAGYDATSSASHGAIQDTGDDAAAGMPHIRLTDAMDEDNEVEHLDSDIDMESLDSSQIAELMSQATGTDGEDTRIALLHLVSPKLLELQSKESAMLQVWASSSFQHLFTIMPTATQVHLHTVMVMVLQVCNEEIQRKYNVFDLCMKSQKWTWRSPCKPAYRALAPRQACRLQQAHNRAC